MPYRLLADVAHVRVIIPNDFEEQYVMAGAPARRKWIFTNCSVALQRS